MLLGEPPRTQYDLNFSLFGIPIRVDPWFWIITLMLGYNRGDAGSVLTWVIAVFLSILVHEMGHASVMRAYGFQPWITLYGMGGLASYDHGYSRSKGSDTVGQILISLAGPGAGFLLAAVLVAGLIAAGYGDGIFLTRVGPRVLGLPNPRLADLINSILFISVLWGMVNLLPIYPLDGGQIAREVLLRISPSDGIRQSLLLSMVAGGAMAAVGLLMWKQIYVALMFGYLAYTSYATLQAYGNRRPW